MKITVSLSSLAIITGIVLCILKACDVLTADWTLVCIPFYVVAGLFVLYIIINITVELIRFWSK